ncbi:MAG: NAD-dependent deacylase [Bacteriovoracales bacterium]
MFSKKVNKIVILTGAGISAESGIKTFRGNLGLWEEEKIEEVATPEAFRKNPKKVFEFYNLRKKQLLDPNISPNPAHLALANLEKNFDGEVNLITQNVDNLHERAGSKNIIHMHGELLKIRCQRSKKVFESVSPNVECPCCKEKGNLRPHIVWFGEMPLELPKIFNLLRSCQLFIAIGTSGSVYPAAGFVEEARKYGAHTININDEESENEIYFHRIIRGRASIETEKLVKELLSQSF